MKTRMNKWRIGMVLILVMLSGIALIFFFRTSEDKVPDYGKALITHVSGRVFIVRDDAVQPALPWQTLEEGDLINVMDDSMAQIQVANKVNARLDSNTFVQVMKIAGVNRKMNFHTEVLTGLLSYRVNSLDEEEFIVVEAGEREFEVRGTVFALDYRRNDSRLLVSEGSVEVRSGDGARSVSAGMRMILTDDTGVGDVEALSTEDVEILEVYAPLDTLFTSSEEAGRSVEVEISTIPSDSIIYIDGQRTGKGHFHGIIPLGHSIKVRVRRRNFVDETVDITGDVNRNVVIELKPDLREAGDLPDGRVKGSESGSDSKSSLGLESESSSLQSYERRVEELSKRLKEALDNLAGFKLSSLEARDALRKELNAQLEIERVRAALLETELLDKELEIEKLKGQD